MIDCGIWSPTAKSKCAHGMVVASKKDGGVRITSDLFPLNKFIIPDRHPLPLIEDLISKLDLRKGYYHIKLDEDSWRYTAIMTPLGLMAYNRLPMGLQDAAAVFLESCIMDAGQM